MSARFFAGAALLVAATVATPVRPAAAQKVARTLDFEAVPTNAAGFNPAPFATLGGFGFGGWGVLASGSTFGAGTNAVSGTRFAYGFTGQNQFIFRDDPLLFDFRSAFLSFRTFDQSTASASVTVRGYRGPAELFTRTLTLTNSAQLFTFDWADVDEVAFESQALNTGRSAVLAMDDVTLAVVPEPATVVLVAAGGAVLVAAGRRRRTKGPGVEGPSVEGPGIGLGRPPAAVNLRPARGRAPRGARPPFVRPVPTRPWHPSSSTS